VGMSAWRRRATGRVVVRGFTLTVLVTLGLFATACGNNAPPVTKAERDALEAEAAAPPKVQPGEKVHITVYDEPSLTGDYQVDPSGFLSLPLAGTVKAAGLNQQELEQELTTKYRSGYLKDPKITVGISEFRPFYIVGEVEKPGAYPYSGGLTVLSAIAIAGGTTYRANQSSALIQHVGDDKMHEYNMDAPIPILPGDIIQIPRRYF
jgi:protein involved in polysaccharide export with SLBB domain